MGDLAGPKWDKLPRCSRTKRGKNPLDYGGQSGLKIFRRYVRAETVLLRRRWGDIMQASQLATRHGDAHGYVGQGPGNIDYSEAASRYQANGVADRARFQRFQRPYRRNDRSEVKRIIDEVTTVPFKKVITDPEEEFERLAKACWNTETLTGEEIKRVMRVQTAARTADGEDNQGLDKPSLTAIVPNGTRAKRRLRPSGGWSLRPSVWTLSR